MLRIGMGVEVIEDDEKRERDSLIFSFFIYHEK